MAAVFPDQLEFLLLALIEKLDGGFRPVGNFTGYYRVWARARRPIADEFLDATDADFCGAAKGKAPTDLVWRAALRREDAANTKVVAATVLWDLVKFYERIRHAKLIKLIFRTLRLASP